MDNKKINEVYDLVKKIGYVESINISLEMDADSAKDYNLTFLSVNFQTVLSQNSQGQDRIHYILGIKKKDKTQKTARALSAQDGKIKAWKGQRLGLFTCSERPEPMLGPTPCHPSLGSVPLSRPWEQAEAARKNAQFYYFKYRGQVFAKPGGKF